MYTGREYDPEKGTYHYRARDYDPKAGRFLQKDPIGFKAGDVNLYRYVQNNPVNWVDPTGLEIAYGYAHGVIASPSPSVQFTYGSNFINGSGDLYRNYQDMRQANTIGADKYFHCMGHCEASRRGQGGKDASKLIGEGRERFDEYVKNDPRAECDADRKANRQGRNGDPSQSCKKVCESLRPPGLNQNY